VHRPATGGPAQVAGLAAVVGGAVAVVSAGSAWFSADGAGWSPLELPVSLPTGADGAVAVAGAGRELVLVVESGQGGGAWLARMPAGPG
jgi:hypothetical protein